MIDTLDTVVAVATASGRGTRAMLRLSGPVALEAVAAVTVKGAWQKARRGFTGYATELLAEDLRVPAWVTCYRAPRSYTREDMVELLLPASEPLIEAVLRALLRQDGVRAAGPGEFTLRAFLNGRIDLAQAEAVAQLIGATDETEARAARRGLEGALGERVDGIGKGLREVLALLEAGLDFPDEDLEETSVAILGQRLQGVKGEIEALRASSALRLSARGTWYVVLGGLPNAGKSSLLNAVVGQPAALVSPLAGTTRDPVKVSLERDGLRMEWVDIAGLGAAGDDPSTHLESRLDDEARRTLRRLTEVELTHADLVLWILDPCANVRVSLDGFASLGAPKKWLVVNKIDRLAEADRARWRDRPGVSLVSARTGEGLEELIGRVLAAASEASNRAPALVASAPRYLVSAHQETALLEAAESVENAVAALGEGLGDECVAADVRQSLRALAELHGQVTADEILDIIFSRFCLGK